MLLSQLHIDVFIALKILKYTLYWQFTGRGWVIESFSQNKENVLPYNTSV